MNKIFSCAALSFAMALPALAGNLIFVGDSTLAPRKPEQRIGSWGDSMGDKLADGWKIVNVATGYLGREPSRERGRYDPDEKPIQGLRLA